MLDGYRTLYDVVDKDMLVYEISGVMDVPAQNAALLAMGAMLDQMLAELKTDG
jgi:hypothetical protein